MVSTAGKSSVAQGYPEALLLTPQQAANALSLSQSTLYELMGSGQLGFVRIGRARRIPVLALHQFVEREMQRQGFQR